MHIVINQLSCKYFIFILTWSAIIAFFFIGWAVWQAYVFVINSEVGEDGNININGNGVIALLSFTISLIAVAMWGASWFVDCHWESPYHKAKWDREWNNRRKYY